MHEAWVDRWKGLLILLVVVGHVVGGAAHVAHGMSQTLMEGIYRLIYLFHMPAFFAVAGVCWKPREESFGAFAGRKARRLLIPYLVFGVASIVAYLLMQGAFLAHVGSGVQGHYSQMGGEAWWQPFVSLLHAGGWPHGEGFRANSVLWFLPCLFMVNMIYWGMDRLMPRRGAQLVAAAACVVCAYGIRKYVKLELPWGIGLAVYYLPFVIGGRWLLRPLMAGRNAKGTSGDVAGMPRPCGAVIGRWSVVILAGALFLVLGWRMPSQWFAHARLGWYLVFLVMAMGGIVLSAVAAKQFSMRGLEFLGGISMTVMLVHKFPVIFLETRCAAFRHLLEGNAVGGLLSVLMVTGAACAVGWGVHGILVRWAPVLIGASTRKGWNK